MRLYSFFSHLSALRARTRFVSSNGTTTRAMKNLRLTLLFITAALAPAIEASSLVRITRVLDAQTIVIADGSYQRAITLRAVPPESSGGQRYLESLVGSAITMTIHDDGSAEIFRASDSLWVNDELRQERLRTSIVTGETHPATYFGEALPGPSRAAAHPAPPRTSRSRAAAPQQRPRQPRNLPHLTRSSRRRR